jgi:hypothetical protein
MSAATPKNLLTNWRPKKQNTDKKFEQGAIFSHPAFFHFMKRVDLNRNLLKPGLSILARKEKMLRLAPITLVLFILLIIAGCAETKENIAAPEVEVPDWVMKTPFEKGKIYAVGVAGVTYYRSDAQKYAAREAREELSRTLNVRIQSVMVEWTTEKGTYVDKASLQQVAKWATDVALTGSTILAYWYDEHGVAGPKSFTYALAMLSLDPEIIEFASHAQDAADPEAKEKVKQNAKKLFEELERMEQNTKKTP